MDRIERSKQKSTELFGNTDFFAFVTDPDFADILNHFIFGDVFYHGRLNDKQRELITLVVLATNHTLTQLRVHVGVARRMAAEWGHVVILKGAFTVIANPDGRAVMLPFANPALATAGSGDVLAGAIVGLLAQGLAPFEAATCGAFLHGLAGEIARRDIGEAGVVAGDVLTRLPAAIRISSRS